MTASEQPPVEEVVEVVPPCDAVVEVEGVSRHVDEEGQRDQDVGPVRARLPLSGQPPDGWNDERCQRVREEPPPERLALELVEAREGAEREQTHQRGLDGDVQPEKRPGNTVLQGRRAARSTGLVRQVGPPSPLFSSAAR